MCLTEKVKACGGAGLQSALDSHSQGRETQVVMMLTMMMMICGDADRVADRQQKELFCKGPTNQICCNADH